jgi:benzoyl-CoA 2,3-dioxygenase component A
MSASTEALPQDLLRQHLIDPEICIRCNTCEDTCPVGAITHDARNYVVDPDVCNACGACLSPCPTGSIDNWRTLPRHNAYSPLVQFGWESLPAQLPLGGDDAVPAVVPTLANADGAGASRAPRSAATPSLNLAGVRNPVMATVAGNVRLTDAPDNDVRHVVLDLGSVPFPVLEGQSIGIIAPGLDAAGRPHVARQYSIASPRDGERPGYNNLSLTVKRVTQDHAGQPFRGLCSNYVCDLQKGDKVQVIGPFGSSFLMPDDPAANLIMICTGTGSAPMRAMTERRRRLRGQAQPWGKLMLFFGARTPHELPYFGPLMKLPAEFIDIHLAFSRHEHGPRSHVQDKMREQLAALAELLRDNATHIFVCGVKGMEEGVLQVLAEAAALAGLPWPALHDTLRTDGRLQIETY